jgi:anion-transporting  ArsA/GET3 family ATPase
VLIEDLLRPKILIVSGKGGVGKTTVAASLAVVAARAGRKVCIAEVDRKGTLPRLFGGGRLGYQPRELSPGVWGMNIVPEDALAEYLDVQYHMKRISRAFTSTQFVDYITTAAPGLKDILILGKVWYLEQDRGSNFDTIVVDAPAAGHMLTFLSAPAGLSDAVRVGPIRRQAEWLAQMLRDPNRSRVHLVALPEEMPVTETLETFEALEGKLGIDAGPVFANAVYSPVLDDEQSATLERMAAEERTDELEDVAAAADIRMDEADISALVGYSDFLNVRRSIQEKHLRTLERGVDEPVLRLPFLFSAGLALPDIERLADVIQARVTDL